MSNWGHIVNCFLAKRGSIIDVKPRHDISGSSLKNPLETQGYAVELVSFWYIKIVTEQLQKKIAILTLLVDNRLDKPVILDYIKHLFAYTYQLLVIRLNNMKSQL